MKISRFPSKLAGMDRIPATLLMAMAVALLAGCNSDGLYRGIYEGTRTRNQALKPPSESTADAKPLDYDQYQAERQRLRGTPE